jgi:uncharacterized protein YjbJ (UPF0337 family)
MEEEGKKKSLISKIKSSPAAKQYREEGPLSVAKTLGGMAKEGIGELADKAMDAIMPLDNTHMQTRQGHFNQGAGEHIYVREDDSDRFDRFTERGVGLGSHENVSSILNGVAIRGKKAANRPEGY